MNMSLNEKTLETVLNDNELDSNAKLVYKFLWKQGIEHGLNSCGFCNQYIAERLNIERKLMRPTLSMLKRKKYLNIYFIRCLEFYDIGSIRTIELSNVDFERKWEPINPF